MANSFTSANVSAEAVSTFARVKSLSTTRFLVLKINEERIDLIGEQRSTVSLRQDYGAMKQFAERHGSCYFVFRFGPSQWTLITYCPDSCVAREKMLYSSTQGSLTRALDPSNGFFTDSMHASDLSELDYAHYEAQEKSTGTSALSHHEKEHLAILASEDEERKERASLHAARLADKKEGRRSSGYHAVAIPFADSAVRLLDQFKSAGGGALLSLCVSENKDSIEGVSVSSAASAAALPAAMDASNPRFYFWKNAGNTYFIYACPSKSPVAMRMVYSTAKNTVVAVAKDHGVTASKNVEVGDVDEVNADSFKDAPRYATAASSGSGYNRFAGSGTGSNASSTPPWVRGGGKPSVVGVGGAYRRDDGGYGGDTVNARNSPKIDTAHPIYSMMSPGGSTGPKKKIVIPPRGAY
eukprot:CAMPEP_0177672828 /NCGR_PEP_ID=MMETSP0447-20121125/25573_1 /TAXON_ID=0 /ORGANISM="Stygamoeba regulata, Strain BSH-02190019" /LENGTH=410 /DNA_ID=CAMNT_0019180569 /DNA_START=45 /DNA_END=1277 /DNA_ORIENTATION=-